MWLIFEDFDWTFSKLLSSSLSESLESESDEEDEEEQDEDDEEEDLDLGGLGSAMIGLVELELVNKVICIYFYFKKETNGLVNLKC